MSEGFTVPQREHLLWVGIDLDNTIAEAIWTPDNPTSAIGAPIRRNIVKVREMVRAGYKAVIHTSRPWSDYEAIEAWCLEHDVPASRIVCGKLLCGRYYDDRNGQIDDPVWSGPKLMRTDSRP